MIEYAKAVLPKVILFDLFLFQKELTKCVKWAETPDEYTELQEWAYERFGDQCATVLNRVFDNLYTPSMKVL